MRLNSLVINGFRNYKEERLATNASVNIIYGKNGQGKTNLLEAIYYSILTQSFKAKTDQECINYKTNQTFFDISSVFTNHFGKTETVRLHYERKTGKELFVNGDKINRFREHIGFIPIVLLKPADSELTFGSPSERRRFIDVLLSQLSAVYLDSLIRYRRLVKQKNTLLQEATIDHNQLDIWNGIIVKYGSVLVKKRINIIQNLSVELGKAYKNLSKKNDSATIFYQSSLKDRDNLEVEFEKRLHEQKGNEIRQRKSLVGPHRDDLSFLLNEKLVGRYGSQGENKSFLISLKLAELNLLKEGKKEETILLLDDIFSELDSYRTERLMEETSNLGQLFITSTRKEFVNNKDASYFLIENGQIIN